MKCVIMTAALLLPNSKVQNIITEYVYHIYYIVYMKYSDNTMHIEYKRIHRLWRKERKRNIFQINVFFSIMIFPCKNCNMKYQYKCTKSG